MTTAILDLELTKAPDGTTSVTKVGYVPYYMIHRDSAPVGEKRFLLNIHQAMEEYEAGTSTLVDKAAYGKLQEALDHAHKILGAEGDLAA